MLTPLPIAAFKSSMGLGLWFLIGPDGEQPPMPRGDVSLELLDLIGVRFHDSAGEVVARHVVRVTRFDVIAETLALRHRSPRYGLHLKAC